MLSVQIKQMYLKNNIHHDNCFVQIDVLKKN